MLLEGFTVAQLGPGLAAAVCGRMMAEAGASVVRVGTDRSSPLAAWLNAGDAAGTIEAADLIVAEGSPATLRAAGWDEASLRRRNPGAAIVLISPFGQTGPRAEEPAGDLALFFASGIARLLTGQVDDLSEPPMAPVGRQSAFIGGLAAACAGMHAALPGRAATVDVSIQQALATLAITELTRASQRGVAWRRRRESDGNGATVCILPAGDGYAAISPREEKQWAAWVAAMGNPDWAADPRFARKADRVANWDALHALMSAWSRQYDKRQIATLAQAAHVPSFPLLEVTEHLESAQLRHRGFFRPWNKTLMPGTPFGVAEHACPAAQRTAGPLPLSGIRVLDFSWVIAGPTTTRILAAMGAEVIKVEAPNGGDPGRGSELHTVLGQGKKTITLDLKKPEAVAIARDLAARSDVLIENFATGVMDRLGLGEAALRAVAPDLIYVSASGLGRTGPEARAVAYGTLLQCYAGFAGLNRHPGRAPRVGMAWLDPMCGLMLAFSVAASVWRRRRGVAARIDFSMIEAMLWTMAEPLLAAQGEVGGEVGGEADAGSVRPSAGDDAWVAEGPGGRATALASSLDLVADPHLRARGFWETTEAGLLPGLPWAATFGQAGGPARGLGADTDAVLRDVLGLGADAIGALRRTGTLG
ncbi:MAG TPA: CoA transferase [Rhodopila sp.]|uniref:CaiB/BaiF CoA-transferase family protein n=1 Tax=Rhodopila sp. TaxID=2480087 RepID=UPI002CF6B511|nr:CoA transferase [Rhodopila sp.]HVY17814.1 CoA transferase [Rhodopila sp.]